MAMRAAPETAREREALLGLWAVPGVGRQTLASLRATVGRLGPLLDLPPADWLGHLSVPAAVRQRLAALPSLRHSAAETAEHARRGGMEIAYREDFTYPAALRDVADAPPLLFYRGQPGPPRRRLALVGSRHPDTGFLPFARRFAREIACAGVGVVSGAAAGVDRACHWGALDAGGETWAFVGSALDALDPPQAQLLPHVLAQGGVYFSELPPGVRASPATFPRRNRLISGASDAVLVLRAGEQSGALYTALAARAQGRPLLALPGEADNAAAFGCNALIRAGHARLCLSPRDAVAAVARPVTQAALPLVADAQPERGTNIEALSAEARIVYAALARRPAPFDAVLATTSLAAGALSSALTELELAALVVQHPGRLYEKV